MKGEDQTDLGAPVMSTHRSTPKDSIPNEPQLNNITVRVTSVLRAQLLQSWLYRRKKERKELNTKQMDGVLQYVITSVFLQPELLVHSLQTTHTCVKSPLIPALLSLCSTSLKFLQPCALFSNSVF